MTMAVRLSVEPKFSRFHAFYGALVKYSVGAPKQEILDPLLSDNK